MKKASFIIRTGAGLASLVAVLVSAQDKAGAKPVSGPALEAVAVVAFDNQSKKPELDHTETGLIEMLSNDLSQVKTLTVVKAAQKDQAVRVIKGSFLDLGQDKIGIKISFTDVKNGKTTEIKTVKGSIKDLFKLEKNATFKLISAMGLVLGDAEYQAIETIPTLSLLAFTAYSRGLEAENRGDTAAARQAYAESAMFDANYKQTQTALQRLGSK